MYNVCCLISLALKVVEKVEGHHFGNVDRKSEPARTLERASLSPGGVQEFPASVGAFIFATLFQILVFYKLHMFRRLL